MSGIETKNYKAGEIIYSINDAAENLSHTQWNRSSKIKTRFKSCSFKRG